MVKAVIDVGSNSVLLLVARRSPSGWDSLLETTAVTALGEGTRTSGVLGERAIRDTLLALKNAFVLARDAGATEIVAAVTMAGRIASNTSDFLIRAMSQETPVFVLSGEDEARLGFLAVADDPQYGEEPVITTIDVGGHSTELVTAARQLGDWSFKFKESFPVGTLGIRDSIMTAERASHASLLQATSHIDSCLGSTLGTGEAGTAITLGATGTNLVSIREKMTAWNPSAVHGENLSYEEVSRAAGWLSAMSDAERAAVPGLEKGREKTIHIGALILERALFAIGCSECRVSVRGWRHALLDHPDTASQTGPSG